MCYSEDPDDGVVATDSDGAADAVTPEPNLYRDVDAAT